MTLAGALARRGATPVHVVVGALAVTVLLQAELALSKSVNWDEFFHFSMIHQHLMGRPTPWLQTPYIKLFSWVPALGGDAIAHIQLIRLLILPFELVTIAAVVAMARQLTDRQVALFCGLLYATGGYVFLHGFALRGDVIAAALLMAALWIGLCRPLRAIEMAAVAALVALAFVATIKSVLYAPAFLGVALYRLNNPAHRRLIGLALIGALLAGLALLSAGPYLPTTGVAGILRDMATLGGDSIERMFTGGLFPQGGFLLMQALLAPVLTALILLTAALALKGPGDGRERLLVLGLLAPLMTVAVYRNAFPYHFAFILPPAAVAVAPAAERLVMRYGLAAPSLLLLGLAAVLSASQDRGVIDRQRAVVAGIHQIFPEPVAYIDNSGMAGDFPRPINQFASGWALENYRQAGLPAYSRAMEAEPVPLLLVNNVNLQNLFTPMDEAETFLPEDAAAIRDSYIPHWGVAYVAGKEIPAGPEPATIEIRVPGEYTVEGGAIVVDGVRHGPGSVVGLERGPVAVGGDRARPVTLRWGNHLPRPTLPWPRGPLFTAY